MWGHLSLVATKYLMTLRRELASTTSPRVSLRVSTHLRFIVRSRQQYSIENVSPENIIMVRGSVLPTALLACRQMLYTDTLPSVAQAESLTKQQISDLEAAFSLFVSSKLLVACFST